MTCNLLIIPKPMTTVSALKGANLIPLKLWQALQLNTLVIGSKPRRQKKSLWKQRDFLCFIPEVFTQYGPTPQHKTPPKKNKCQCPWNVPTIWVDIYIYISYWDLDEDFPAARHGSFPLHPTSCVTLVGVLEHPTAPSEKIAALVC